MTTSLQKRLKIVKFVILFNFSCSIDNIIMVIHSLIKGLIKIT